MTGGYAIPLYFDAQTEQSVRALRRRLFERGISGTLAQLAERPHVSLAVFAEADSAALVSVTRELADKASSLGCQLSAIGTFPTNQNALFLSPAPTAELLALHSDLHGRLAAAGLLSSSYYLPGNWIPHCSVEFDLSGEQLMHGIQLLKGDFQPLHGRFEQIGVVRFAPVQDLGSWSLGDSEEGTGRT